MELGQEAANVFGLFTSQPEFESCDLRYRNVSSDGPEVGVVVSDILMVLFQGRFRFYDVQRSSIAT